MPATDPSKRGKGRMKIEIKPISNACFSKRRHGLFKKASELCILSGTEAATDVFSPSGKQPFSCGHSSADPVISRFLSGDVPSEPSPAAADPCELIKWDLAYWSKVLEKEMRRHYQLKTALKAPWPDAEPFWWGAEVQSMGMAELMEYENILLQHMFVVDQCWIPGLPEAAAAVGGDAFTSAVHEGAAGVP